MNRIERAQFDGVATALKRLRVKIADTEDAPEPKTKKPAKKPEEGSGPSMTRRIGEGLLASQVAGMGTNLAGEIAHAGFSPAMNGHGPVDLTDMQQKMAPGMRIQTHQQPGDKFDATIMGNHLPKAEGVPVPHNDNAFVIYNSGGHSAHVAVPHGAHEAIAAHEFGHLQNRDMIENAGKSLGVNGAGGLAENALRLSRLGSSVSSPIASAVAAFQKDPTWTPGLINAGMHLPQLADEAGASLNATRYMIGKYGLGKGLYESRHLVPAFGTYAIQAGGPLAITGVRKAYRHFTGQKPAEQPAG